jgi:amino acid adenylation domain-containing protein
MDAVEATSPHRSQDIEDIYALTPLQEGLLFHALTQSGLYVEQVQAQFRGDLNVSAFQKAWQKIAERHAILRTAFWWEGLEKPVQIVRRQIQVPWQVLDWRAIDPQERAKRLEIFQQEDRQRGFELSKAPLLRFTLIRLDEDRFTFIWTHHHLLLDGWSMPLVLKEVLMYYQHIKKGEPFSLAPPRPYRDYIAWLQRQSRANAEQFWRNYLAGLTVPSHLPVIAHAHTHMKYQHATLDLQLSREVTTALLAQARRRHVTINTLLQGAWALLLSRYSGKKEVIFGTTVAGRPPEVAGIESMVGMFINTLPVRIKVTPEEALGDWLAHIQAQQAECQHYGYTPLIDIQEWSELPRGQQLFESLLVFENYPSDSSTLTALTDFQVLNVETIEKTNYPIVVQGWLQEEQLALHITYDIFSIEPAMLTRIAQHLRMLLEEIARKEEPRLADFPPLTDEEYYKQLVEWNETRTAYPREATLPQLFEEQVAERPDAIALVYGEEQLSYSFLDQQANRVAQLLRQHGIEPEVCVGLYIERSPYMIIALLGILKAGGAYVPLDPQLPPQRFTWMLRNAQVRFLLTHSTLLPRLPKTYLPTYCLDQLADRSDEHTINPPHALMHPLQLAYVMYTSGSTGIPKGVGATHRAIVRLVKDNWFTPINEKHILLQFAPLSFDASTLEIWGSLLTGARLIVLEAQLPSLDELGRTLQRYAVNMLWLTAGLFHQMVESQTEALSSVKTVLAGGDVLNVGLVRHLLQQNKGQKVINGYGPTENTTFTCCYIMEKEEQVEETVPIGRPISNTTTYVLDEELQPVPIGSVGELYTGGDGLARGYIQQADRTAEKFIPHPFSQQAGERLYRTGDLVRYLSDGRLEFLGRSDQQVKVRGFRIELGEIETVLAQHEKIRECAVIAWKADDGDSRLVAYLIGTHPSNTPSEEALRQYIRERLPDYMVPSYFLWLEALPLTPNGKIDRQRLKEMQETEGHPFHSQPSDASPYLAPPWDDIEFRLLKIWAEILHIQSVDVSSNFFELGGHSLMAVRLMSRIRQEFGQEIALEMLFRFPTIAQLATVIRRRTTPTGEDSVLVPLQVHGAKTPLFCVHPAGGTAFCYANLARLLGPEQPFYSLRLPGWVDAENYPDVQKQATLYIEAIRTVQQQGPYHLAGWSFGGIVAFEMAQQLQQQGQNVSLLAIIDSIVPGGEPAFERPAIDDAALAQRAKRMLTALNIAVPAHDFDQLQPEEQLEYASRLMKKMHMLPADADLPLTRRFLTIAALSRHAAHTYVPQLYHQRITLFRATETLKFLGIEAPTDGSIEVAMAGGWQHLTSAEVDIHLIPGDHEGIVVGSAVQALATSLQRCLKAME